MTPYLNGKGGAYMDTHPPAAIVTCCCAAIKGSAHLDAESRGLRDERYSRWSSRAASINEVLARMGE